MNSQEFHAYYVREAICTNDIVFIEKLILGRKKKLNEYRFFSHCETVLMLAARNNSNLEMFKLILASSDNINAIDQYGATALMHCLLSSYKRDILAKMALLIQRDIDINAQNNNGDTALIIAVKENRPDIVELLLDANADRSIKNSKGETALSLSSKYGYSEIIELINNRDN